MAISKVTVYFPCPMEQVWQNVSDLSHTAWRSDLKRVEILDESRFVEHTKSGYATEFTVTACEPLRRLEDALPGTGHIAVLHGEDPAAARFTGRDCKRRGADAFGAFHKSR